MKKITFKLVGIMLLLIISLTIIPTNIFATTSKDIQIIKAENGDYIVYAKDLISSAGYQFAISDATGLNPDDLSLNYINSVTDKAGNQVALIEASTVTGKTETNIYIDGTETKLNLKDAFSILDMEQVETTTQRIQTTLKTNIEQRNEEVNGIKYIETVGGMEISDENKSNCTYEYTSVKLPADKYSTLQEYADELNEAYSSKNMYEKIEFAKKFNNLYKELIDSASWENVDNYLIKQPIDAQKDDKYIVLLKRTAENQQVDYDAKFMVSYREDEEEKIPARTETKEIQETSKLPITGDSLLLFVALAVIVVALIIVFVRMKQLKNQGKN